VKCPFCQFDNEDGALFCEQCKSDLSATEAVGALPLASPMSAEQSEPAFAQAYTPAPVTPVEGMAFGDVPAAADAAAPTEVPPPVETMRANVTQEYAGIPVGAGLAPGEAASLGLNPKLVVLRGVKIGAEYPVYEGLNFIGRSDEKPVDIDLEDQEQPERIWSSRQHACISFENGILTIEDLNSSNGTFVNRARVYPGQKKQLNVGDVVQIGTVQMKVKT
jgi:FHA domain-containing protein